LFASAYGTNLSPALRGKEHESMAETERTFSGEVVRSELELDRALFVSFSDGARTFWHTHDGVQLLVITEGEGWFQYWDEPKQALAVGDVVVVRPNEKHWHGARRGTNMVHLATLIGETHWLEEVTDPN
jgi:quercetin dioxygenase-like cupin family protein